jgi:hypothetical protein
MAKKAFKYLRPASLPRCSNLVSAGVSADSRPKEINLLLWLCAGCCARLSPPTRKSVASRWLTDGLDMDRIAFIVQGFRRITW